MQCYTIRQCLFATCIAMSFATWFLQSWISSQRFFLFPKHCDSTWYYSWWDFKSQCSLFFSQPSCCFFHFFFIHGAWNSRGFGCEQFTKKSRNVVWDVNVTRLFWFTPLKIFRGGTELLKRFFVFSVGMLRGEIRWHLLQQSQSFRLLRPWQISRFNRNGRLFGEVTNTKHYSQTEILNQNFPNFFVNGKQPSTCVLQCVGEWMKNVSVSVGDQGPR